MSRPEQDPEIVERDDFGSNSRRYRHPAYGQISLQRVYGETCLYGSDFGHRSFLEITVHESEFDRDLSRDWPHATREILRLAISEAQWAAFVSSIGVGEGVRCTLEHVMGDQKPATPYRDAAAEHMPEVDKRIQRGMEAVRRAQEALKQSGLSAKRQEPIADELSQAEMEFGCNLRFASESFGKAMETRVEKAKVEVNAYLTNAFMRAGIASLKVEPPVLLKD